MLQHLNITFLSTITLLISLLFQASIIKNFSLGIDLDLFYTSIAAPGFISGLALGVYNQIFIARLSNSNYQQGNEKDFFSFIFFTALILCILFIAVTSNVVYQLTIKNTYINSLITLGWLFCLIQILLISLLCILKSKEHFYKSIIINWSPNLLTIVCIFFNQKALDAFWVLTIIVIGNLISVIISYFYIHKIIRHLFIRKITTIINLAQLKHFLSLLSKKVTIAILCSIPFTAVYFLDSIIAPKYGAGFLSIITISNKIIGITSAIFLSSILVKISTNGSRKLRDKGIDAYAQYSKKIVLIAFAISLFLILVFYLSFNLLSMTLNFLNIISLAESQLLFPVLIVMLPGMAAMLASSVLLRLIFIIEFSSLPLILFSLGWPLMYLFLDLCLKDHFEFPLPYAFSFTWLLLSLLLSVTFFRDLRNQ